MRGWATGLEEKKRGLTRLRPHWVQGRVSHFRLETGLAALRQNGPIPFSVPPAFSLAQHPGLALVDRVADLAQQLVHQACPTVPVGVDDKGEIPKDMRPAYLMLALEVWKAYCPAIVDQRTGVDRNDADKVDGLLIGIQGSPTFSAHFGPTAGRNGSRGEPPPGQPDLLAANQPCWPFRRCLMKRSCTMKRSFYNK